MCDFTLGSTWMVTNTKDHFYNALVLHKCFIPENVEIIAHICCFAWCTHCWSITKLWDYFVKLKLMVKEMNIIWLCLQTIRPSKLYLCTSCLDIILKTYNIEWDNYMFHGNIHTGYFGFPILKGTRYRGCCFKNAWNATC